MSILAITSLLTLIMLIFIIRLLATVHRLNKEIEKHLHSIKPYTVEDLIPPRRLIHQLRDRTNTVMKLLIFSIILYPFGMSSGFGFIMVSLFLVYTLGLLVLYYTNTIFFTQYQGK